jgi:methylated-DNA-[protein]-cysteine S-methyltransferase
MEVPGFTLFDTAIGPCGLVFTPSGVRGVYLPEANEKRMRARIRRLFPTAEERKLPHAMGRAISAIAALLAGEPSDLSDIPLDLEGLCAFDRRVYAIARSIPPGRTLTYGAIAARLGSPEMSREVGQAMGRNPFPIVVPCHRVLGAGGRLGGFSAPGGSATKLRLLAIEKARTSEEPTLFDAVGGIPPAAPAHGAGR